MKKVLIVAHLYHASPRIPGLAKYLPEFGWQPIVLTTPIGEESDSQFGPPADFKSRTPVVETLGYRSTYGKKRLASKRYKHIKSVLRLFYRYYREITQYPDSEKNWKPFAVEEGNRLLQKESVDALISSSSPATSHLIASELKRKHGIPWIADFRDLWTQNHNYPYGPIRKVFERKLELKTLSVADALVTVSEWWSRSLAALHHKEVCTVTNGFDPDMLANGKSRLTPNFTITYTGQIYTKQDPSKLVSALRDLLDQGALDRRNVEARFYGPENETLTRETENHALSDIVKQYGMISREISFEKQKETQLLLLLNWEDPAEKGVHTGKIFEYLAAQRPILATGGFGNDAVSELLSETDSGTYCQSLEQIKKSLVDSYSEYKSAGKVNYRGKVDKINKYSYREMARRYSEILNRLVRK